MYSHQINKANGGFKNSETLLGIETGYGDIITTFTSSFKNSETLLGIETSGWVSAALRSFASKTLKPF